MRVSFALAVLAAIGAAACVPASAARETATAAPTPTVDISALLPDRSLTVTAADLHVLITSEGADALADRLRAQLPDAWAAATRGLGHLTIAEPDRRGLAAYDVQLVATAGSSIAYHYVGTERRFSTLARVYEGDPRVPPKQYDPVQVALHELAHFWCCYGPGTTAGHWADDAESGLMNALGMPVGLMTFSDREMRELGLSPRHP